MIIYLLKMILCASLFLIIYLCFLEKEKMHQFKRFYLLLSLVFSITVPLITIYVTSPFPITAEEIISKTEAFEYLTNNEKVTAADVEHEGVAFNSEQSIFSYTHILLLVYVLVSVLLLIRFVRNIVRLILLTRKYKVIPYEGYKIILVDKAIVPHSFIKYIYLNKDEYEKGLIEDEILVHELAHLQQKHSYDILFIELLLILFWFNPICYFYKSRMMLNHEFLADERVVKDKDNIENYQIVLLNKICKENKLSLASNFNYLITKKRLIMMTKTTSKRTALYKKASMILAFSIAFCIFSGKTIAGDIENLPGIIQLPVNSDIIIPHSGVSPDKIAQYKEIVSKYGYRGKDDMVTWKSQGPTSEELKQLYITYIQMTDEQRYDKDILIRFVGPLTSKQLRSPSTNEWNNCLKSKHIWVDGIELNQAEIKKYKRNHFVYAMRNMKNEEGESQVFLWTEKGLKAYKDKYEKGVSTSELLDVPTQPMFSITFDPPPGMTK